MRVAVLREQAAGERRVAVVPETVKRLRALGLEVLVESGAGAGAWFGDTDYADAGAVVVDAEGARQADVLLCVRAPEPLQLRRGQVLVGLLSPLTDLALVDAVADAGATAVSLDGLPRTLSRAQTMDALSSQANVAGYKAALLAADAYPGYFPMLTTAAGTIRPARVLVIGAGVAGLQAIATARRLGAVVTGYDVRDAARADVLSTGAAFLQLDVEVSATGEGGYARALREDEQRAQRAAMARAIAGFDVVISTAQVPGRRPPLLVDAASLDALAPGSVVVDLAAGPYGGNVEGSIADSTTILGRGVTVIGAGNLPSAVPRAASTAYSRNMAALLAHLVRDGALVLDLDDEVTAGVLVVRDGDVVHPAVQRTEATA